MGIYMNKPNTQKYTIHGKLNKIQYAVSSMQGWRNHMEDAHICLPDLTQDVQLYGVLDGHGGFEVSKFVEVNFAKYLLKSSSFQIKDYENALKETFLKMDELLESNEGQKQLIEILEQKDKNKKNSNAGCTANIVLIANQNLYVANAGDARALLYSNGQPVRMSEDHKPENQQELERILQAGGNVYDGRVNGNLNLSRAIGDLQYKNNKNLTVDKQLIIAVPDIKVKKIEKEDKFIIIGCDGVWETLSDKKICRICDTQLQNGIGAEKIVEELLDLMIAPDTLSGCGCDNMTIMLITLNQ
ncbi:protein phosphatase 2c, putative [Ichthyophthirius multifiliis]|uniref:protein-serine/threonine phosphatase n=1 Tax=Ichthyophthirius multifiliis TaxID=5932 RepID=G0QNG0_ICHMU|nr:protein phosphatase 2c, putative [Ichthyophthirius multifiliis]EGR33249.1 protein phosphatase 2c, putative [Ichthyophthirius multifiliis]|eukprot:XP_004037235.1 protein phosphatase 2c, putative [Ichthyophthirius multifiliis]